MLHCILTAQTLIIAEYHGIAVTPYQWLSIIALPPQGFTATHLVSNGCLFLNLLRHCSTFTDVALLIWQSVMLPVFSSVCSLVDLLSCTLSLSFICV